MRTTPPLIESIWRRAGSEEGGPAVEHADTAATEEAAAAPHVAAAAVAPLGEAVATTADHGATRKTVTSHIELINCKL
jgi:hypothetical protein